MAAADRHSDQAPQTARAPTAALMRGGRRPRVQPGAAPPPGPVRPNRSIRMSPAARPLRRALPSCAGRARALRYDAQRPVPGRTVSDRPERPTREQAEEAVRVLLRWAGEDPAREGLLDTPKRVVKAYTDWFSGYALDPDEYLARTFEEVCGYDEMIVLRDIEFESHCEHHMAPIIGKAHVGYLPDGKVVGISKLARVVEAYARRFQVQEKMTSQIANCIERALQPRGVGVVVEAVHECMTTRGIHKRGVSMVTSKMLGTFRDDARTRAEFLQFVDVGPGR